VKIVVQGDSAVATPEEIKKRLALRLLFEPDEVEIIQQWEDGPIVVDERGNIDR
jgi:hypothetical protein